MKTIGAWIVLTVFMAQAASAGDLRAAAERAGERRAFQGGTAEARHNQASASGENPYLWPAVGLMVGGATIAAYGFTHQNGVDCAVTDVTVGCKVTHATGVGIAGLVITGGGAVLYFVGEGKKHKAMPEIGIGAGRIKAGYRFRF